MSINFLFYIFSALVCGSALLSVLSKNSVHAVLYLVITFFSAAWVMLLLNAEFLALLLIIIYVGAIAILFLFVVMMLHTHYKYKPLTLQTSTATVVSFIIFVQILSFLLFTHSKNNIVISNIPLSKVSHTLYIENFVNFQIVALILLIAMVSAILLTLQKSQTFTQRQNICKQVLRKKEDCIEITNPLVGKGITL
ncbi:MAG: NADH-quinone oxidoreductase subunit J [Candidatus Deianiraeaceae bacterium]|jgi:NADH-quinone oxidoreductase subunit J